MSDRNYDFVDNPKEELVAADERIDELQDELDAALSKVPRWIRVDEWLPERNCKVLAFGFQKHPVVCSFRIWNKTFLDGGVVDGVTHWMPLPEPPEVTK